VSSEDLDQAGIEAIAAELERDVVALGGAAISERKDLEPATVSALGPLFGGRVQKSRKVLVPHWAKVGQVDLVLESLGSPKEFSWLAELKWCGRRGDVLFEGIWDLFKMALAGERPNQPRTYLVTGAPAAIWNASRFADLFDDRDHDPIELCHRDTGGRDHWLAWDALLDGGDDRYPDQTPAVIRTSVVGRAAIGDSEIRAVEVASVGAERIPFLDGWPNGERPAGARRPVLSADAELA
jgi:hypothetical protein